MSLLRFRLLVVGALLSLPLPAAAQRTDILTGQPVRPRTDHPRREPEIFNAPHAPRQPSAASDYPPMEIYVAPQIGTGIGNGLGTGADPRLRQADPYRNTLPRDFRR